MLARAVPFDVHHYPEHRLSVIRYSGAVSGEEIVEALARFAEGPWEPGFAGVADLRAVTRFRMTTADRAAFEAALRTVSPAPTGGRTAYLVRGELGHAAAHRLILAAAALSLREYAVHYTPATAAEWLGVPPEVLDAP
jgi:hypothetical protein